MTANRQVYCPLGRTSLIALLFVVTLGWNAYAAVPNIAGLKTFGTSGKAVYPFTEGSKTEAVLYEYEGTGCLTHMWFGGNWPDWEKMHIRVYVDGEQTASIDFEMFLGHGIGFKDDFGPWGTKRIGKTGHPSGHSRRACG